MLLRDPIAGVGATQRLERHPGSSESVHLRQFPQLPAEWRDDKLMAKWENIRAVRRVVTDDDPDLRMLADVQLSPRGFDVIQDVVEARGQPVDVLSIERRDECGVEASHDLVGQLVTLVLGVDDAICLAVEVRVVGEQVEELIGSDLDLESHLLEQIEERFLARDETEPHSLPPLESVSETNEGEL